MPPPPVDLYFEPDVTNNDNPVITGVIAKNPGEVNTGAPEFVFEPGAKREPELFGPKSVQPNQTSGVKPNLLLPSLKPGDKPTLLSSLKPGVKPNLLLPSLKPGDKPNLLPPSLKPGDKLPSLKPGDKPSLFSSLKPSLKLPSLKPGVKPSLLSSPSGKAVKPTSKLGDSLKPGAKPGFKLPGIKMPTIGGPRNRLNPPSQPSKYAARMPKSAAFDAKKPKPVVPGSEKKPGLLSRLFSKNKNAVPGTKGNPGNKKQPAAVTSAMAASSQPVAPDTKTVSAPKVIKMGHVAAEQPVVPAAVPEPIALPLAEFEKPQDNPDNQVNAEKYIKSLDVFKEDLINYGRQRLDSYKTYIDNMLNAKSRYAANMTAASANMTAASSNMAVASVNMPAAIVNAPATITLPPPPKPQEPSLVAYVPPTSPSETPTAQPQPEPTAQPQPEPTAQPQPEPAPQMKGGWNGPEQAKEAYAAFQSQAISVLDRYMDFHKKFLKSFSRKLRALWKYSPDHAAEVMQKLFKDAIDPFYETFAKLTNSIQPINTEHDIFANTTLTSIIDKASRDREKLYDFYNNKISNMDMLFNATFFTMYGLKLIRALIIFGALFLASRTFQARYVSKVFANNEDPPNLLMFVVIYAIIETIFMIFLVIIMFLMKTVVSAVVDDHVFSNFLVDYGVSSVIIVVLGLLLAMIVMKKKYFRYRSDGLRAIRSLQEMMFYVSFVVLMFPYYVLNVG